MATSTPHYGLPAPSPTTRFKDLGAELLAFGTAVDELLHGFDYQGADPDHLTARVTALEAARQTLQDRVQQLEASRPVQQSGQTQPIGQIAAGGTFVAAITFPKPFAQRPMVGAPIMSTYATFPHSLWIAAVTPTGMTIALRSLHTAPLTLNWGLQWDAYGVLA